MHRLASHAKGVGDGLPAPALLTGIRNVNRLEPLVQPLQCTHGLQARGRVGAGGRVVEVQL